MALSYGSQGSVLVSYLNLSLQDARVGAQKDEKRTMNVKSNMKLLKDSAQWLIALLCHNKFLRLFWWNDFFNFKRGYFFRLMKALEIIFRLEQDIIFVWSKLSILINPVAKIS